VAGDGEGASLTFGSITGSPTPDATLQDPDPWPSRDAPPPLRPGDLHVWAVALALPAATRAALWQLLDEHEHARAERLRMAPARNRFVAARGASRLLLAAYAEVSPLALSFRAAAHGKPGLDGAALRWLHFNVAHSEALALVAVAAGTEVGVDVEHRREVRDAAELAARYFAPADARELAALPAEARTDAFLRRWTRLEAVLKATGEGFTRPLESGRGTLSADEPARRLGLAGCAGPAGEWSLHSLDPAPGYVGAVAARARAHRLSCFTLNPERLRAASARWARSAGGAPI
jgi:4'-phosphopantetheinyl transferase